MKKYKVIWEMEIEALTPYHAAKEARKIQLDPDNIASFYEVINSKTGSAFVVDLLKTCLGNIQRKGKK